MTPLVLELQRDAVTEAVPILALLRKAMIVATKLSLSEFQTWIHYELNGYTDRQSMPEYRFVRGRLIARNPFHGWQPVIVGDEQFLEIHDTVCNHPVHQSISELADLVASSSSSLHICLAPEIESFLVMCVGRDIPVRLEVSRASFQRIVETTKNTILNWALKLESDGILGEGLSFSEQEKAVASSQSYQLFIQNMYGGNLMSTTQNNNLPNAKISGGIAGRDYTGAVIHNYADQKNLAEAAAEIQQILKQLEQTYPTTTLVEKAAVAEKAIATIETNPTLRCRIVTALKSAGLEAFKEAVDHPLVNILAAGIEGWCEGK